LKISCNYIIYDKQGKIIFTNANLHGELPRLPNGVLADALNKGELRFTWQMEPKVRQAVVIDSYQGIKPGFVLVGRSLREVEQRIDNLSLTVFCAWVACLAATFVTSLLYFWVINGKKK